MDTPVHLKEDLLLTNDCFGETIIVGKIQNIRLSHVGTCLYQLVSNTCATAMNLEPLPPRMPLLQVKTVEGKHLWINMSTGSVYKEKPASITPSNNKIVDEVTQKIKEIIAQFRTSKQ